MRSTYSRHIHAGEKALPLLSSIYEGKGDRQSPPSLLTHFSQVRRPDVRCFFRAYPHFPRNATQKNPVLCFNTEPREGRRGRKGPRVRWRSSLGILLCDASPCLSGPGPALLSASLLTLSCSARDASPYSSSLHSPCVASFF